VLAMTLGLAVCAQSPAPSAAPSAEPAPEAPAPSSQAGGLVITPPDQVQPGPYVGTSLGYPEGGGLVTVTLDVQDRVLTLVEAKGPSETVGIGSVAIDTLPGLMLANNTIDVRELAVDVVSMASYTSRAVMSAAEKALAQAGLTNTDLVH
ncbi:MAG: FMN-binding protein, partial [Treponema sp.]|nr:FMN-binding protein [Treponema sp.]